MSSNLTRKKLKLMDSLRTLGKKEGATAAGYVSMFCSEMTTGIHELDAPTKRDLIAFSELFEIDEQDLAFVMQQFSANGLSKKTTIKLALAQLVINCLAVDKRFQTPLKWIAENIAFDEGKGPVPEQDDMGS